MAKNKRDQDLFDRLRAGGLRKRVANVIAEVPAQGSRRAPKSAQKAVSDLRSLVGELEDRVSGGPAKRTTAARKGAATRRAKSAKRSAAAKKAARTRARS